MCVCALFSFSRHVITKFFCCVCWWHCHDVHAFVFQVLFLLMYIFLFAIVIFFVFASTYQEPRVHFFLKLWIQSSQLIFNSMYIFSLPELRETIFRNRHRHAKVSHWSPSSYERIFFVHRLFGKRSILVECFFP